MVRANEIVLAKKLLDSSLTLTILKLLGKSSCCLVVPLKQILLAHKLLDPSLDSSLAPTILKLFRV